MHSYARARFLTLIFWLFTPLDQVFKDLLLACVDFKVCPVDYCFQVITEPYITLVGTL